MIFNKPVGIFLISIFSIFCGGLALCLNFKNCSYIYERCSSGGRPILGIILITSGFLAAVLFFIVGIGLWELKKWGKNIGLVLFSCVILIRAIGIVRVFITKGSFSYHHDELWQMGFN